MSDEDESEYTRIDGEVFHRIEGAVASNDITNERLTGFIALDRMIARLQEIEAEKDALLVAIETQRKLLLQKMLDEVGYDSIEAYEKALQRDLVSAKDDAVRREATGPDPLLQQRQLTEDWDATVAKGIVQDWFENKRRTGFDFDR